RKRHLAARVAAVAREAATSTIGAFARFAAAAVAAVVAVMFAVWVFPFHTQAQSLPDDRGISCDAGFALLHRPPLHYPVATTAGGAVWLDVTVNSSGSVTDARVVSGPEELRRAALEDVFQWRYAPNSPTTVHPVIAFAPRGVSRRDVVAPQAPPLPAAAP